MIIIMLWAVGSIFHAEGERFSSMVERLLVERWVIRTIPHGRHIELFLVPANTP